MVSPSRTLVIGIAGGIASGKSAVSTLVAGERGRVVVADRIAREVLHSPEVVAQVAAHFGPDCIGADGLPDREALAARVFADPAARETLEGWIHPRVRANISAELADAAAAGVPVVVLDVPLLFENDAQHGLVALCDAILFVEAPLPERDARAVANRGWQAGEVARREAAQLPLSEKRDRATHVVRNSGTPEDLKDEVARVLAELGAD
ncbi:MAG: dephospho-CoA kinase [Planctomycetota bacterium]|nr:dephospho-CoA kinase [Planctomycetota bacterium]